MFWCVCAHPRRCLRCCVSAKVGMLRVRLADRVDLEVSVWGHVVRSLRDGVYGGGEGCV